MANSFFRQQPTMIREKVCGQESGEQPLRSHVEFAAAGKTNLTDEQLVDLLLSTFPQFYSRSNRKFLTERVARITPLPCRRGDAADEPTPVTNKRRKIDETKNANSRVEVSAVSASSSEEDYLSESDGEEFVDDEDFEEFVDDDEIGEFFDYDEIGEFFDDRREMNRNGDGGWRDANCSNRPISRDLEGNDEIGDGRGERNKNNDSWWRNIPAIRDVSGNNRPMFRALYGMGRVFQELRREVVVPLQQLKLLRHLGVEPAARILLHGPRGCGKTTLARAIANEAGVPLYEISAAALVSGVSGAPEDNIRELFSTAYMRAPSIVFIDEIDTMISKSKTESLQKEIEPHIVNQLMTCMDELYRLTKPVNHGAGSESSNSRPGYVLVIGATNRPDAVDPALRRRFDREIVIGAPDETARFYILSVLVHNLKVEVGFDPSKLARCTLGYVGGDLVALVKKAGIRAVNRIVDMRNSRLYNKQFGDYSTQLLSDKEMENLSITMADFVEAAKMVKPSSKIERFSTTPNAKWEDVVGLQLLKLEFEHHIISPIKFPEVYKDLGVNLATSFFLYGPSGCGKTMIVEALANEAGANYIHIKASELLEYGDQSGLVVQIIFNYASTHSPCIVLFDELDVITPYDDDHGRWPDFRQLIVEINAAEQMRGVYVIGATNRREIVRHFSFLGTQFDKILYVPRPSPEERGAILKALARNKPIDANVDLMALGKDVACENFNGAYLSALMKEAAKDAIDRPVLSGKGCSLPWTIKGVHFKSALAKISSFVSSKQAKNC